jgi:hypothetical protein
MVSQNQSGGNRPGSAKHRPRNRPPLRRPRIGCSPRKFYRTTASRASTWRAIRGKVRRSRSETPRLAGPGVACSVHVRLWMGATAPLHCLKTAPVLGGRVLCR